MTKLDRIIFWAVRCLLDDTGFWKENEKEAARALIDAVCGERR